MALKVAMIAATIPPAYSGAGAQALALAAHLHERGVTVDVLTYNRLLAARFEIIKGVTVRRCPGERLVRRLPHHLRNRARLVIFSLWLSLRLSLCRYDVYHAHGIYLSALPAAILGRLRGVPLVIKVTLLGEDDAQTHAHRRLGPIPIGWLYNLSSRMASTVIATNQEIVERHRTIFPMVPVVKVPNGVDFARFAARADSRSRGRRSLRLDDDAFVAVFVGYITERKGVTDLLQGWFTFDADRRVNSPDARLLLVGPDADFNADFACTASELATSPKAQAAGIRVLSHVLPEDMPDIYASSDLFVLPTRGEGMPNSLLEALAAGLPAIASAVPGVEELLVGEPDSVLVPPASPPDISRALHQFVSDFGGSVQDRAPRVPASYSLAHTADRYVSLYENLLKGRAPRVW